ncbi:Putative cytochrome P450 140 [Mycobacterium simulans]|uniref:Cytochrome P450 140 n=1 Tax=Mycobacterium simulans TaxID=627089 RepID=A0A7Z7IMJ5_9MYCO|nr:cytochrome P450 [Mycobacterium simulans]SOJ56374.1 Putative cytochrome P450 140 [Mycobacterium simulans]
MRQRLNWFAQHGFLRGAVRLGVRLGDLQSRLLADPMVKANPAPFCDELRAIGPLASSYGSHLAVDHAVVHELLRSEDFEVFSLGSNLPAQAAMRWLERRTRNDDLLHPLLPPSLLAVDPPDHTRYRKAVSSVFTAKAVAALRDRVEETASALLDQLTDQPSVDIMDRYCSQLPIAVIGDILGVPDHDRSRILEFGELAAPSLDFGLSWRQYQQMQRGLKGLQLWLTEHLEKLRSNPGDDLMSQLIQASENGPAATRLNASEVQTIAGLVLGAGFETTVNLLGNGIQMLLDAPEQRDTLNQRPQLWPNAVEEILRLESPIQLTGRIARKNVEVAGAAVKRGQLVVLYLAAANRDPSVFADPHRFDVARANANRHLTFAAGRHFCLGAALARAEGEIGLRMFFDRFPDASAAGSGRRRETRTLRGWSQLPVQLCPTRSAAIR